MSSNDDWLSRQQRMVKCPKHGLHFDPKMSTGCMRCLKERAKIRPKRRPQPLIILVCVLGITIALFRMFGPDLGPQEERLEGLTVSDSSAERTLEPEPYRQNIESFEAALFDSETTKTSDLEVARERIRSAAGLFSEALQQADADVIAAREVAALVDGLDNSAWTFVDLEKLRDQWLRIRRRHFDDADWYHSPATSRRSVGATQRASLAEYRDIADELASLLRQGSSEVSGMSSEANERAASWRDFADDLNTRLRDIAARQPSRPRADSDSLLLVAFQNLERAFNSARSLGASKTPPPDASRFDEALRVAEDAVQGFEDAM